jgi:hypothetical protein
MHLFDVMAASQVISCLQSSSLDESWRGTIFAEILKHLFNALGGIFCVHVRRNGNTVAHDVLARSIEGVIYIWLMLPPDCLYKVIVC